MQSFLGFANYYREFIKGHSDILHPMQIMIKKANEYKWTPKAEHVFHKMKEILCSSPVPALPIDDAHYYVDTDASEASTFSGIWHKDGKMRTEQFCSSLVE